MSKCKCGNILQYEDSSILNIDNDIVGIYYCNECNRLYDASILDCEDEYSELNKKEYKRYIKWFSNDYKETKKQRLIHFYEGLLTPLGYYREDKEMYEKDKLFTQGLNTYMRWINDNKAEKYHKDNNLKYNRFSIVKANLKKLKCDN
jgi:hypothetical protein